MNRFSTLFRSRFLKIAIILLIIAAIPLTVFVAQQQQENRQNAAEPQSQVEIVKITDLGVFENTGADGTIIKWIYISKNQGLIVRNENDIYYPVSFPYGVDPKCLELISGLKFAADKVYLPASSTIYRANFETVSSDFCKYTFGEAAKGGVEGQQLVLQVNFVSPTPTSTVAPTRGPTSAVQTPTQTPVPTRTPVNPGNPTRTPNLPNAGKCEGDVKAECGDPNKLVVSWTVSGQNGMCNIYLQAGEAEQLSTDCSGAKEITRFHGSDPLNTAGNPIGNGEVYQLVVSNGGSCSNKLAKEVKVDCSPAGQPAGSACRNLSPSQTVPPTTGLNNNYQWVADCSKSCVQNSDCPQNTTQAQFISSNGSNWCYGFQNNDGTNNQRCMKLTYFANGAPANPVPTQPSSPAPTSAANPVPSGDFANKPAKQCNTTNQCVSGKLTCTGNNCKFVPDNSSIAPSDCSKNELSAVCRITLLASSAPEPTPQPSQPWWCVVLENTPLACGSGISQQTPSSTSGFGFGWFNPFFGK